MASKILIVDDDRDTREMVSTILAEAGYQTITASTLHSAIDALEEHQPDLLITEVRLQKYNGLHLIAIAPNPVPAIVLTGYRDTVLEAEARRLGADFLVKPVPPLNLLLAVREKLGAIPRTEPPVAPRRWERKALSPALTAFVRGAAVRILDASYGGLRFEIDRIPGRFMPLSFEMMLPGNVQIGVDVVWKSRQDGLRWLCGASVIENRPRWRELVDSLA